MRQIMKYEFVKPTNKALFDDFSSNFGSTLSHLHISNVVTVP